MAEMEQGYIDSLIEKAQKAQKEFESYSQEQVDAIVKAMGKIIYDNAELIAKEAVEETGYGRVDSKILKITRCTTAAWHYLHDKKSVGMIDWDPVEKLATYAKPVGVVAALVPTTNPVSTTVSNGMSILKCRNAMIVSPHPRAKKTTIHGVELINEAIRAAGAPENLVQIVDQPSMAATSELMTKVDVVVATGGAPMVKSAYSSGVPAYGSGAGNATVIIDNTCNTAERQAEAAMNTRISKCSDFGSGCSCDGNLIIHEDVYDGFVAALVKEGAYLANEEEAEKLKAVMWDEAGHRLPNTVAISPQKLAEAAGFEIPADRKFIAVTGGGIENVGKEHFFSSEKLTTLLTLFKYYGEFENALTMMQAMFNVGGKGHSCGIYSFDDDHIHRLGMCAPVSRIMVRQPNNRGNSGSSTNGMPPTSSMGCGTWGGNIVSENICLKHYMNTTWVARPLPEDMPSNEELFGEFNKPDMDVE